MKNLSEILKKNRALLDISQAEMSLKLGIQAVRYSYYESGKRNPKADFFKTYKEVFNIDLLNQDVSNIIEDVKPYHQKRYEQKLNSEDQVIPFYDTNAHGAAPDIVEILPPLNNNNVLHINDLFKGSQYAIKVSGNSMTPNYPPGSIIGIRLIENKQIIPGNVYVLQIDNELIIKRLFYKDEDQYSGIFQCMSDNSMKYEHGVRAGKLCYPPFYRKVDEVIKLFKVTGIYKGNELTVIN